MEKKRVIYIMGAGRSGTTLLDIMLGNQEGIFSGGELNRFTFRRGIPTEFPPESSRYRFWEQIKNTLSEKYDLSQYDNLQGEFEHHRGTLKRLFGILNTKKYHRYQSFLKDYYDLIFDKIKEQTLVDSSKFPGRALSLSKTLSDYDLSYIYIIRDPVGVINSFAKKDVCHPPKDWFPANIYYFSINILCRIMFNKLRKKYRCVSIRYENLITKPQDTLTQIEKALEVDLSTVKDKVESKAELEVGNLFEGNRIRIPYRIKLKREKNPYPTSFKNRATLLINGWLY